MSGETKPLVMLAGGPFDASESDAVNPYADEIDRA